MVASSEGGFPIHPRDGQRPGSPLTIDDIAREAGVSRSTVSRVLTGAPNVAPVTRARVQSAVDRLGYRVNPAARSLRTSRTALVGLLVPAVNHEVFGQIAERLDQVLGDHGIGLVIACTGWDTRRQLRGLEALRGRGVDALVVSLADDGDPEVGAMLRNLDRPVVLLDRDVRGLSADAVLTNQNGGVAQAIDHLADLGHRAVGLNTMSPSTRPGREMVAAYAAAAARRGLRFSSDLVVQSDHFDRRDGREAAERLVRAGAGAIISGGPMAMIAGVLERLDELGLRVPDDISVIGYDDSVLAEIKRPRLTVIARPVDEIGQLAAHLVVTRLAGPDAARRVETVPTRLVVRDSTGPPPALPPDTRAREGRNG